MDICTLIVVTTMTTQACFTPQRCETANGKEYCTASNNPAPCANPPLYYDCVTPDGEHYEAPFLEHPTFSPEQPG